MKGEQFSEEFKKINPQHTVPTLVDGDFVLWDSHAIATFLINKYGKDDSLYPADIYRRAKIDQRLHYESSILYSVGRNIVVSISFIYLYDLRQFTVYFLYFLGENRLSGCNGSPRRFEEKVTPCV